MQQGWYSTFSSGGYGGDEEGFDAFCVMVVPELSDSFSSSRALTTVSARGLQGCRSRRESNSQVTRHRGLPINAPMTLILTHC